MEIRREEERVQSCKMQVVVPLPRQQTVVDTTDTLVILSLCDTVVSTCYYFCEVVKCEW